MTIHKIIIDGDITLFQSSAAVEEPIHWGDDWYTLHADLKAARQLFDLEVQKFQKRLEVDAVVIALSDPNNNWRRGVLDSYKANRRGNRKPVCYVPLREYVEDTYECVCHPTLEADDVLGLLSEEGCCIVSDDKDLKTIPGWLYVPHTDELHNISLDQADLHHLTQALTGDAVDGYKGCPGVGPVKAGRILEEGTWDEVVTAYESAGLNEEVALIQARVARILRVGEYDTIKGEVELWNPQ